MMWLDVVLLLFLLVLAVAAVGVRDLLESTILLAVYSLVMALVWMQMHSVDVAFTEASVGAGISTLLIVNTLMRVRRNEKTDKTIHWPALLLITATAALLIYGTFDMPLYGAADSPAQTHVAQYYLQNALAETHSPNVVTAVLASYRGFDTMFEAVVILTAALGAILLLRDTPKPPEENNDE